MNEVDLDRLADFIGGAFEGTPSGTQVSHLVSTVPEWRHAHDHLVAADRAVSHDLQLLTQTSPPMPGDVAARLHAALAAQAPAVSALAGSHLTGSHLTAPGPGTTGPGRGKAPGGPGSRPSQTPRVRRGRRRWSIAAGLTAAVVAVVTGVAIVPRFDSGHPATSADKRAEATNSNMVAGAGASPAAVRRLATGTDYTPETLGQAGGPAASDDLALSSDSASDSASDSRSREQTAAGAQGEGAPRAEASDGLDRLADLAALDACLAAVTARYGGTVSVVDYARFNGSPALVVVLVNTAQASPGRLIVVVGPSCGLPGRGSDERHVAVA